MEREGTVLDAVDRLERAVSRLERIVDGDTEIASPGMLSQHRQLVIDVAELKARRMDLRMWIAGYLVFTAAFSMTIKEIRDILGISFEMALVFGWILIGVALALFLSGLGWMRFSS